MPIDDDGDDIESSSEEIKAIESSIQIHVTNEDGIENQIEEITTKRKGSSMTNITNSNNVSTNSLKDTSNPWHKHSKVIFLVLTWFCSTAFMTTQHEKSIGSRLLSINELETKSE